MSRSHYVYVVMQGATPVAAFTVKWELEGWLHENIKPSMMIYRVPDRAQSANREGVNITASYTSLLAELPEKLEPPQGKPHLCDVTRGHISDFDPRGQVKKE